MSDRISMAISQTRDNRGVFDLTASWYDLEVFAANRIAMDIVGAVVTLAAEWDKALTGGVPVKK